MANAFSLLANDSGKRMKASMDMRGVSIGFLRARQKRERRVRGDGRGT